MKTLVTLDYELFFGQSGTPERCIIEPTKKLIEIADKFDFKCVLFVDAGYLVTLKKASIEFPELQMDYNLVASQIKELTQLGHEIQLHIHPHWEDSYYDGENWIFDLKRFRLSDFNESDINRIVFTYKKELEDISGKKIFAYRAGGWCIQPFKKSKNSFKENEILIDSTVFYNGFNSTQTQWYNFKNCPTKTLWKFEDDPCKEKKDGFFTQIPIASQKVLPFFYWKFIFLKLFGGKEHKGYGDGFSSGMSKLQMLRLLLFSSNSVVSMDSVKATLLKKAFINCHRKEKEDNFVIIGHPKAFSEYSLKKFEEFIEFLDKKGKKEIITYKYFLEDHKS